MIGQAQEFFLRFGSLNIRLETNRLDYSEFLRMYFEGLLLEEKPEHVHVSIQATWEAPSWRDRFESYRKDENVLKLGNNTFLAGHRLITPKKLLNRFKSLLEYEQKEKYLEVRISLPWRGMRDSLRNRLFSSAKEEVFFGITFPIFYYSVFWYLENFCHIFPLHASAFKYNEKGIVFCGLDGIGKTSLALSLVNKGEGSLLSDNLIFFDQEKIYPCYEMVRVHKVDGAAYVDNGFIKVNAFRTLKDYYRPNTKKGVSEIRPDCLIFPLFGPSFKVKKLSIDEAASKAFFLSHIPSEISDYLDFRNLSSLLNPESKVWQEQPFILRNLLRDVKCLEITMPRKDGLENNVARLKEVLEDFA